MRAPSGTALYVHSPFCVVKCHYCDFYSVVVERPDFGRVVDLLLEEAAARAPEGPATVFVGGGTPSMLPAAELRRLLDGLDARTGFRRSAREVTVECNPESLDAERAAVLVAGGATRLSIGLQSLRPEALELFGRPHAVEAGFQAVATARAAGVPRLSVDLIYAHPGQVLEEWEADLARVLALGPEHVSAYHLAFEEGTPFRRWLESGRLESLPEELGLAFFERTRARLEEAGLPPYEISNFAPSGEQCAHNVNYWRNGAYVGIGPSAVSKLGHERFGNPRSLERWGAALAEGREGAEWRESLPAPARLGETWWLGLRMTEGVSPARARDTAGFEGAQDPALAIAEDWVRRGMLELVEGAYRVTRDALALTDRVAASFLAPADEHPAASRDTAPALGSGPAGG